jgi:peptidoglycan/xylan/chitin deacetylase (PgdA/CDA1 family)
MPLTSPGFPLFLTFDLDAETMWMARDPAYAKRPILMSQGAYGWEVGTRRILDCLDRYGLKVTFFVPGLVIDQREALTEEILKRGHEIAHHSYSHAWILNLTPEQERDEMEKGFQSIKRVSGRAPRGWRSPAAEVSPISMPLLVEYGFDYSSNFFDDDSPIST